MEALLLNSDYTFLSFIDVKKAIKLVVKKKVEILHFFEESFKTVDDEVRCPQVVRLVKIVKVVFNKKVKYSKKNVIVRDKYVCQYCGKRFSRDQLTIDHVIPRCRGGKSTFKNTVTACKKCNVKKGDKLLSEARMRLLKQPHEPTINEHFLIRMKESKAMEVLKKCGVY